MTEPGIELISLDIGGTLATIEGNPISSILITLSPRPRPIVREILRKTLQVADKVTDELVATVCLALAIDPAHFPREHKPARLRPQPFAARAISELGAVAPVVTLSNVSLLDMDKRDEKLWPGVTAGHTSCRLGYAKPDTRAFQLVAEHHSVGLDHVVHIGDDWECDALGAARAGAHAVWLSCGRRTPFLLEDGSASRITVVPDLAAAVRHVFSAQARSGRRPKPARRGP